MGITGLIPFLEKSSRKVHLKELRGSTVAVDTYCWLHKGVFSCAEKLVRGEETDMYIQYCLKYVQLLLSYDIKPILVYDGRHLPAKALTEQRRRDSRQHAKKRAAELLRLGNIDEARSHMRRCVDVTHEMALRLIRECRQRNVDCIVAPYEADAQMAWLNKVNLAQFIITEDSDLMLFGARNVVFKLDLTGAGLLVESDKLYLAMGCSKERYTFNKFRRMCILSGCDYLDSLPGIGLAKACKFMLKTEEDNMWRALKKIPQYLNMRNLEVDDEYIENFHKAEATFKHMFIYNPLVRKMERLNKLEQLETDERYCSNAGTMLADDEQAFQLALGNLNPFSLKELDRWHPDRDFGLAQAPPKNVKRAKHKSIWLTNFEAHESTQTTNESVKPKAACALYFKKVDFISRTITEDENVSIKEELQKPTEEDIFVMYRNDPVVNETQMPLKRRRQSSPSLIDSDATPVSPTSPVALRSRCNPFAKVTKEHFPTATPLICENKSLLNILSLPTILNPKKINVNAESVRNLTGESNIKRSIFDEESKKTEHVVEIKSRFFAANLKQVAEAKLRDAPLTDLSSEIDKIERDSQKVHDSKIQLYNHTSEIPNKPCEPTRRENEVVSSDKACEIKTTLTDVQDKVTKEPSIGSQIVAESSKECNSKNIQVDDTEIIMLSDDDLSQNPRTVQNAKTQPLAKFLTRRAPRLGLSKTKTPMAKGKEKSKTETAIFKQSQDQNQTSLSMFGFQKRPTLK